VPTYQASKGKGWGVIAKELGIKPGSPAFHALKEGNFALTGRRGEISPQGPGAEGRGRGKRGKGHGSRK
jgi:hypothetical protein